MVRRDTKEKTTPRKRLSIREKLELIKQMDERNKKRMEEWKKQQQQK